MKISKSKFKKMMEDNKLHPARLIRALEESKSYTNQKEAFICNMPSYYNTNISIHFYIDNSPFTFNHEELLKWAKTWISNEELAELKIKNYSPTICSASSSICIVVNNLQDIIIEHIKKEYSDEDEESK